MKADPTDWGATRADVGRWLKSRAGRLTDADVTPALAAAAEAWLRDYAGGSSFALKLKGRAGELSTAQARGVLNCWRAAARRRAL